MLITNRRPALISNSPLGISIYSVTDGEPHYHEGYLELIYCFKGHARLHVLHEEIALNPGELFSCDPLDIHYLSCSEENLFVSFFFRMDSDLFGIPDLKNTFFVCEEGLVSKENRANYRNLKLTLLTALYLFCFNKDKALHDGLFHDLAHQVIHNLYANFHLFEYTTSFTNHSTEAKERFQRMLVYIQKNYSEKITISQLSKMEHLNANYLSHFFKNTSYLGLSSFVNYIRVYHSELLLLTTDKNVSEVAYESGFSDPKFYHRTFKLWYKTTPHQHKKHYRQVLEISRPDCIYAPSDLGSELEHFIAFYFATLQLPESSDIEYLPLRSVPF